MVRSNMKLTPLLESKKLRVFDFDETLVTTKSKLKGTDDNPDFSDWNTVKGPKIIPQTFKILKNVLNKGSSGRKTVILTARSRANAVKNYLKSVGVSVTVIPKPESSNTITFKNRWIEKQIEAGYDDIEVFDDLEENLARIRKMKKKYPNIKLRLHKVDYGA